MGGVNQLKEKLKTCKCLNLFSLFSIFSGFKNTFGIASYAYLIL